MEKVKLSKLNKVEEYKAIIPIMGADETEYIYILNPNVENIEPLFNHFNEILNGKDEDTNEVFKLLLDNFTNIEVDDEINLDTKDIVLSEVILHLTIIWNQCLNIYNLLLINEQIEENVANNKLELNNLMEDIEELKENKEEN
ncbi:MAG: hypothetical protein ACTTKY_00445 [Catonella sp.]